MTQTFTRISVPGITTPATEPETGQNHATVDASKSDVIARPDTSPIGKDFCEG